MKKIMIVVSILLILGLFGYFGYQKYQEYLLEQRIKNAVIKIDLINPLEVEFNEKVYLDTSVVGEKKISFKYYHEDNLVVPYEFNIKIVDKTPPVIWLADTYTVNVDDNKNLEEMIMCGDNYDDYPKCFINGEYNLQKIGNYSLVYEAIDSSGNVTKHPFTLKVIQKKSNSSTKTSTIPFKSLYNEYKNDKTKIGIDVSRWQGDIDFEKVKQEGVEFVFIKVGGQNGIDGDYYIDPKFKRNIEGFTQVDIPVGLYFYSYANSEKKAYEDALWVMEQIKDYHITLPIAFDWENWGSFNKFHISFNTLTKMAKKFVNTLESKGYKGMLYSSKNYLEQIWLKNSLPIWLAHYTSKTDYGGEYKCWQRTSSAKISGITVNTVDVDICYER